MTRPLRLSLAPLSCALIAPLTTWAAEEPARPHSPAVDLIFALLPFLVMGLMLWWFLRRSQRTSTPFMRRSIEHYERSEQHMQKLEQLAERIAAALEAHNQRPPTDPTPR